MSLLAKNQKQWPPKFQIKFRNTEPPSPPYLVIIPKKKNSLFYCFPWDDNADDEEENKEPNLVQVGRKI